MNPFEEPAIPPVPLTRSEARAAGLKTFTARLSCSRCGSKQRTVHTSRCCGCAEVEKRKHQALAEKVRQKVLVTARAVVLRELACEARAVAKAAERQAKAQERLAAKQQAEKERKAQARAAARAARLAAPSSNGETTAAVDLPPWADSACEADCAAPWD